MGKWPYSSPPTTHYQLIRPPHSHRWRRLGHDLARLGCEVAHCLSHCSLELGIAPVPGGERSLLDFDVRCHALVLDVPLAFEIVEPAARSRDEAAIHQGRDIPD